MDDQELPRERPRQLEMSLGIGKAGLKDGVFFCNKLPQWLCKRIQQRIDIEPAQFKLQVAELSQRFIANVGAAMFLLLPSYALWFKLVYWQRRLRYTEHLVFAFHVHAFWFLMFALVMSNQGWLAVPAVLAIPTYTLLAMRRVYGGRWWPRLARAALVSALYLVVMTLALASVALWALLF